MFFLPKPPLKPTACLLALLALMPILDAAAISQPITVRTVHSVAVSSGNTGADELSGIAYFGMDQTRPDTYRFLVVSDSSRQVYELKVVLDTSQKRIRSTELAPAFTVRVGEDLEGIAYNPHRESVFISSEVGPAIREHLRLPVGEGKAGDLLAEVAIPGIFRNIRQNRGFEAVAFDPVRRELWTANEEALTVDGPPSTANEGTLVRIQKFDEKLNAAGQWAYRTEPVGPRPPLQHQYEASGVVAMEVLPGGELLVLERAVDIERFLGQAVPRFTSRLYEVDLSNAEDVSAVASLEGKTLRVAGKRLLWSKSFGFENPCNYEGMTLGPLFQDGPRSVFIISDDQGGLFNQKLKLFELSGGASEKK